METLLFVGDLPAFDGVLAVSGVRSRPFCSYPFSVPGRLRWR